MMGPFMAEGVGFEPTVPLGTTVFKTAAFNHSAIPPGIYPLLHDHWMAVRDVYPRPQCSVIRKQIPLSQDLLL